MNLNNNSKRLPCTLLLPLFNGKDFLNQSIQNLISIAGPDDEILIIDDGSNDISKLELSTINNLDSRIVIYSCEHRGLVETLNFGIRKATHEFIARVDVDDVYEHDRLKLQVEFLTNHPDISAVFTDYRMVGKSGANLGLFPSAISPELTAFSLVSSQRTAHPSVMYRKSAVIAIGGYDPEDFPAEDLALWIKLADDGKIASLPDVLLKYTYHGGSITRSNQILMRSKSQKLRSEFAYRSSNILTIDNARNLLLQYKGIPYRNLRLLFFIHDLLLFNQFTNYKYQKKIIVLLASIITSRFFCLLPALVYVLFMKFKRKFL